MYERLWPRCSHCPFQRELWLCCFCCPPLILGISTSGCSVQRYSHGTLEWEPTHGRAVVTRVVPTAPSSESCDLVVFVVLPFPWDLHLMVWPLSPAGFIVFFFFVCLFFFCFFSPGIYPSPLLFSVTGAVRLPVWGLLAGISGLPATGGLPALRGTQLPYAMLLLNFVQQPLSFNWSSYHILIVQCHARCV